jgi:hypothetical protein
MNSASSFGAVALAMATSALFAGQADAATEAGMLSCSLEGRTNVVVYSEAEYTCELKSSNPAVASGVYTGKIKTFGVDLTWTADEVLGWAVLIVTNEAAQGQIDGDYIGAGADVAAGLGVGADVLVGGGNDSFALQPFALSGQTGVGLSAGVKELKLSYVGPLAE